jgi:hypothetical protein
MNRLHEKLTKMIEEVLHTAKILLAGGYWQVG